MAKPSKRLVEIRNSVEPLKFYGIDEAIEVIKRTSTAKFDESIDVAFNLGVNPKYPDQMVRGAVALPHGTGKEVRVVVFARGEKVQEARDAGADRVGAEDLIEEIKGGWLEFDRAIATPDVMGLVGRIGRILGPRGLMPNPKVGTVTFDVAKAVRETKAGRIEFRTEKAGVIHAPIGRASFDPAKLRENLLAMTEIVLRLRPSSSKGTYMKSAYLSSTMGAGVRLDISQLTRATA